MTKIAIIDDEYNVRELLKKLVSMLYPDLKIVGEAPSILVAKKMITATSPDIVLLDIELEDGTGFTLLDQLDEIKFKLVFITAFNQHAVKAFKYNALDYLLKPIEPEEFKKTLDNVLARVFKENELQTLLAHLQEELADEPKKIVINTIKEKHILNIADILYCQSEGAYTKIIGNNINVLASKNLKHYQDLLPKADFIRTHQSYLVNKDAIASIKNNKLLLHNEVEIPISTRRKSEINEVLLRRK